MRPLPLPSGIRSTEARPSLPPSTIEAPGAANVAVAPGPVGTIVVPNDDASQRTVALQTTAAMPVTIEEVREMLDERDRRMILFIEERDASLRLFMAEQFASLRLSQ